jgi:WD40 repeat protein
MAAITRREALASFGAAAVMGTSARAGFAATQISKPNFSKFKDSELFTIGHQVSAVCSIALSANNELLAASAKGGTEIQLWHLPDKRKIWQFRKPLPDLGRSLAFTRKAEYLICSTALSHSDGPRIGLSLIDVKTGKAVRHIEAPVDLQKPHVATAWAINVEGTRLAVCFGASPLIAIYDSQHWSLLRTIGSAGVLRRAMCFDPIKGYLAVSTHTPVIEAKYNRSIENFAHASDRTGVEIWDVESGTLRQYLSVSRGGVSCLHYIPGTNILLTGSRGLYEEDENGAARSQDKENLGLVRAWDTGFGTMTQHFPRELFNIEAIATSPDGAYVAAAAGGGRIRIWDRSDLSKIPFGMDGRSPKGHVSNRHILFAGNNRTLIFNRNNAVFMGEFEKE